MRFRLVEKRDFDTCRTLLHPGLRLSQRVRARIVEIWEELAQVGPSACVVEDPGLPHPRSLQGFGVSAFVVDSFVEEFLATPRNYLDAMFYERIAEGRSPVIPIGDIGRANAAGELNLVVPNYAMRHHDFSKPYTNRVLQTTSASFYFFHAGYHLRLLLGEVFGPAQTRYMEMGGFRALAHGPLVHGLTQDERPALFAMRPEWIAQSAVHPLSFLFHTPQPHLGFSAAEQRILFQALLSRSDAEIARNQGQSLDSVKKTWRRIYERVERLLPSVVATDEHTRTPALRGTEKRRHLLDYLRANMQEIRPWSRSHVGTRTKTSSGA